MAIGIGTGCTVVFSSGSTFTGEVLSFSIDDEEVPVIDVSSMSIDISGGPAYRKKKFGKLKETPGVNVQINYNPATPPPVGTEATLTITWPDSSTMTGTGAFVSRSSETPLEDKMTASYLFKYDGQTGPSFA